MKVLDFVLYYQYFDSLETKIRSELIELCRSIGYSPDRIDIDLLRDVERLKIRLEIVYKIESDLKHFFLDIPNNR